MLAIPAQVIASGELWRIDEEDETEQLSGSGTWVDPYIIPPVQVVETRPEPTRLGHLVRTGAPPRYLWNSDSNWWIYDEDEWKEMEEPSLMVTVSGDLKAGNFITSDRTHYVSAETEDVERIEWRAKGLNEGSGTIVFKDSGTQPDIIFDPLPTSSRDYLIGYTITGRIGSVSHGVEIKQSKLSQLRQEYVDKKQKKTPKPDKFDQDTPHHPKLADPNEVHSYHEHHIVRFINTKAIALENAYSGTFYWTAGYVCPGRNTKHVKESQHIYGTAIDFDAGSNIQANSKKNFDIYWVGENRLKPTWSALYDSLNKPFTKIPAKYKDAKPTRFVGKLYNNGQLDWR